ncbi:efflux RND transporter periplasmic adaptor subunit [Magnetococcales bacterium HHB-1]
MQPAQQSSQKRVLPPLREDLELHPGPKDFQGLPTWTIYDPVQHRYFRLRQSAVDLLTRWHLASPEIILDTIQKEQGQAPTIEAFQHFLQFLQSNSLLQHLTQESLQLLEKQKANKKKRSWYKTLMEMLFFRIPLAHPQALLNRLTPLVTLFSSRAFYITMAILGCVGMLLTLKQWDRFSHTFIYFFSWEGAILWTIALIFTKTAHEFGHALAAHRYGCRVATIGMALLLFWPVLYTDVSDAWRLPSRRQRLYIGAAGMVVELFLAVIATFLWHFLPPGPLQSSMFFIATITWIMTLGVNLNPFLRFDGYYLLSDYLRVENLQQRAFALAQWRLRRFLFNIQMPPPEVYRPALARILIIYAYATWAYRFLLFFIIAALVYALFLKVLGLLLFFLEVGLLVLWPMIQEMRMWWKLRDKMRWSLRGVIMTMLCIGGVFFLMTPQSINVKAEAVYHAAVYHQLQNETAGKVYQIHVRPGEGVDVGQPLITLWSPELDHTYETIQIKLALIEKKLARATASDQVRAEKPVLLQQHALYKAQLKRIGQQREKLILRTPIRGIVRQIEPTLHEGLWIEKNRPLVLIIDPMQARIRAFVHEEDLRFIAPEDEAQFIPDDLDQEIIHCQIEKIAPTATSVLDYTLLASTYGGPIATAQEEGQHPMQPQESLYRVDLTPLNRSVATQQMRAGQIAIEGAPQRLITRLWQQIWAVIIRESGF